MWTPTTVRTRAAALLAGLVAVTAIMPLLAPAAPVAAAPTDGRIAFASDLWGDFDIYTINEDGTGRTNITPSSADDMGPAWFGGSKIAFASNRDGDFDIYTMNADGSDVTQITQSPGYDGRPTWSPDGTKLAFVSARSGKNQIHIQSVNAPGAVSTQRTYNGANTAPWWGAGNRITFTRKVGTADNEIMVMNADGTGLIAVTNNTADDRNSRWVTPDRLTFQSDLSGSFDIVNVNVDGSNRVVVTTDSLQPVMAPSGQNLAFIKGSGSGQELYVSKANGTARIRLTTDSAKDETPDWGVKTITFVPHEQKITNVQAVPTGLTATVTFHTSRLTNQALVRVRQDATFMRFNVDSGAPTRNHSIVVSFLRPGVPYTITVTAPKVLTSGEVMATGAVTTHTRQVKITGQYADVIDDSDNSSCGELAFFTFIGGAYTSWGSEPAEETYDVCSGEPWDPEDRTFWVDGVVDDEVVIEFKGREDDWYTGCNFGDDCYDTAKTYVTLPVLDYANETTTGLATVHVVPDDGDQLELIWHYAWKVSYHA
ncbi:MAG TPA: hypothetical protein VGO60_01920 [Iamia sp.]|jgi:Tol biopolymer transport system component|nr:hypothetical protein [Iamia sp.]